MANEKRLIDADALYCEIQRIYSEHFSKSKKQVILDTFKALFKRINNAPAVDSVEVVRCKYCEHSYDGVASLMCGRCGQIRNGIRLGGVSVKEEHYCSHGERRENV